MKKGLTRKAATAFSWIFILPTISSTFWLPMWIALALVFPTIFNYFPETPNPISVPAIPQWFFRILYVSWIPLTLMPGTEWVTEFLYLPEVWTNNLACLFLELIRPWLLLGGFFLFLASLIQLLWHRYRAGGLVTKGFYSVVRHPQYLGIFIWIFGHLLYSLPFHLRPADVWAWATLVFAYIALARSEEKSLEKRFGQKFEEYRREVPFLVPFAPSVVSERLRPFFALEERSRSLILALVYIMVAISILGLTYGRTYLYWQKEF